MAGSGSTAQQNAMKHWLQEYQNACPEVQLRYNPIGSGGGVAEFLLGATHFGGSDTPLSEDDVEFSSRACPGSRAIDLPMVGGPVAIGYNVDGVDSLVLDASTLARIFDSRITMWNDPEIRRLNPGAQLPETEISAVHRSDDSGTTQNFNAYLADAAPDEWPYEKAKAWQARGGHAASGSDGVVSTVSSQNGSKWEGAAYHATPSRANIQVRGVRQVRKVKHERAGADLVLTSAGVRSGPFGCVVLDRC
ncbi:phosphate ABC transporter substrate-binding protein PstS [Streptomyces sp. NPDC005951]|uniref:phosphate ABC transporter substrate-binding protein PstS n=1 Tax=Streptomyces sp. NPDC005951 TaxID=3154573 RepID=UPI0033DA7278